MNKRIQELAERAGIDFISSHNFPEKEFCEAWPEQLEKFAQLIIKDILDICEEGDKTQTTCGGIAILIREKFGVK